MARRDEPRGGFRRPVVTAGLDCRRELYKDTAFTPTRGPRMEPLTSKQGATLAGTVARYAEAYRLCYIRGPEGLLLGLAEKLG